MPKQELPLPSFVQYPSLIYSPTATEVQVPLIYDHGFPGKEYRKDDGDDTLDGYVLQMESYLRQELPSIESLFTLAPFITDLYVTYFLAKICTMWLLTKNSDGFLRKSPNVIDHLEQVVFDDYVQFWERTSFEYFLRDFIASAAAIYHPLYNSFPSAYFSKTPDLMIVNNGVPESPSSADLARFREGTLDVIMKTHQRVLIEELKLKIASYSLEKLAAIAPLGGEAMLLKIWEA